MGSALWFRPDRAIQVALGTTAHDLCSETFFSGLDPGQTFAQSLAPRPGYRWLARGIRHGVDRTHPGAHASLLGLWPTRAVFRDGIGCVVVHGDEAIARPSLATMPHRAPSLASTAAHPHQGRRDPARGPRDRRALRARLRHRDAD